MNFSWSHTQWLGQGSYRDRQTDRDNEKEKEKETERIRETKEGSIKQREKKSENI